jgi:hypothetical protein
MDLGWGCGYRNCQMLMSFLERHQQDGEYVLKHVPDITGLQLLIEQAWKEGNGEGNNTRALFKQLK